MSSPPQSTPPSASVPLFTPEIVRRINRLSMSLRAEVDRDAGRRAAATLALLPERARLLLVGATYDALAQPGPAGLHAAAVLAHEIPDRYRPDFAAALTHAFPAATDEHIWIADRLVAGFGADVVSNAWFDMELDRVRSAAEHAPGFIARCVAQSDPRPVPPHEPDTAVPTLRSWVTEIASRDTLRIQAAADAFGLADASEPVVLAALDVVAVSAGASTAGSFAVALLADHRHHDTRVSEGVRQWRSENASTLEALRTTSRPPDLGAGLGR